MVIIAVCSLAVVVGIALALWWGSEEPPPRPEGLDDRFGTHAPIVARKFAAATAGGAGAGLLIAGSGGRLVMRLLAATAGDQAQGRLTEADQRVGVISVDGTLGLIVFGGIFFGLVSGFAYVVVRRWLPRGRWGGVAFGALLLVLAATRVEPLRRGNVDFDIVGPGWVAVLSFGALVVVHGMLVVAIANRWERFAAGLEGRRRLLGYLPLLIYVLVLPFLAFVTVAGAMVAAFSTQRRAADALASARALQVGRIAIAAVALVALPFAVLDLANIASRGPG